MGLTEPRPSPLLPGMHRAQSDSPAIPLPRTGERERTAAQTGVITTTVGKVIAWGRYSSLWPALFGLAWVSRYQRATSWLPSTICTRPPSAPVIFMASSEIRSMTA